MNNVQLLEKLNSTRLPRKYHAVAETLDRKLILDIARSWDSGDNKLYNETLKKIPFNYNKRNPEYYILAIWLHPLTALADVADGLYKHFGINILDLK